MQYLLPEKLGRKRNKYIYILLQVSEVDEKLLEAAKEVEELDLSNNRLVKIPTGLFRATRRLTTLHLHNNIISFINRQSFIGN